MQTILIEIGKVVQAREEVRDKAKRDMQKARSLSKQAILLGHQNKFNEAKRLIEKARKIISRLNDASKKYPKIIYGGLFDAALQEYSEANIFLTLIQESRFVAPEEIGVPSVDYILGLGDVVGEYRRLALDFLREGSLEEGEECLRIMEEIYTELTAMDEAYMLVSGLRRKCDIARRIIEATRGDVTQEVRRNSLEKSLRNFENFVKKSLSEFIKSE